MNGEKVASQFAAYYSIPRFDFDIHSNGATHTVTVEIRVTLIFFTTAFRISIDGQPVYSEGNWPGDRA